MTNETTKIGDGCFAGCTNLTTVNIVDSNDYSGDFNNIQEGIVQLPKKLKRVSALMFNKCESITKAVIPDGITSIDSFAFTGAVKLNEIT